MELSSEDSLRLNVLLANAVAIRIDEGTLTVYGLSKSGDEARIRLNPNARPDQYVRRVRELLSSAVLGSPGGYPVYLKRWTRMGQAGGARLADLLMLGEPEAVVAVAGAPGLTDELARYAWWAMPDSENARRMLRREAVAQGQMGKVLAAFLVEFLPFEQDAQAIIESVRLILQPGLIDEATRMEIWERGRTKGVFRIGFLQAVPDQLPEQPGVPEELESMLPLLEQLAAGGNRYARQLLRTLSGPGQAFVQACEGALRRPSNQDAVCALLDAIGHYFADARVSPLHFDTMDAIIGEMLSACGGEGDPQECRELTALLQAHPELESQVRAVVTLAHVGEPVVRPIFARTDAVGSVMRRKLEPVVRPIQRELAVLRGTAT
ncbi:MAG: sulfur reduction protein DsrS [Gammaproteobacteria bacterium]